MKNILLKKSVLLLRNEKDLDKGIEKIFIMSNDNKKKKAKARKHS